MAESWHVAKGKTKLGPYSRDQLKRLAQSGQLQPTDMLLQTGSPKWMPASTIVGLFTQPQPTAAISAKQAAAPKQAPSKQAAPSRQAAPPKQAAPTKPTAQPPVKRSKRKALAVVGAVLAACGCLCGGPVSLAAYYLYFAPASGPETLVAAAAKTHAVESAQQPAPPVVPNTTPPIEATKTNPPKVEPPKSEPPKAEPPKAEPPKAEPPKVEPPKDDPPKVEPPKAEPPTAELPKAEPPKMNPPAGDQLTAETLRLVKQATVYLRVTLPDGRIAQGSGFLAGGPNVVLTNGHVLGMLSPDGRPPQKIEVVVNSGTAQEKTYAARFRQVDARADLAALEVDGVGLPSPLALGRAKDLFETQAVFVFGFPFGKQLGRNITVSKSSVSSIRTKADNSIQDFIVSGGMHPGNSGGPVVDANGLVVGVSVAIIAGTQINFAIAGETVQSFLTGRREKWVYMAPYKQGDKLKLPIRYHMTDPLGQIAKVHVETWTGKAGPARAPTPTGAAVLPDDSPRQGYEFTYQQHKAVGEVDLPSATGEPALWVQMALIRRDGTREWHPATVYASKLAPVERRPVTLTYTHRPNIPYKLELTLTTDLKVRAINGLDKHFVTEIKGQMIEQLLDKRDAKGSMAGLILFKKVTFKDIVDKQLRRDPIMDNSLKSLAGLAALTLVDAQGDLKPAVMVIDKAIRNKDTRADLAMIGTELMAALEVVTVPLPGREVRHENPWKVRRQIQLGSSLRSRQPAVMDVDYILHGLRERDGRPDAAVIFLFGQVRGAKGAVFSASGYMDGTAVVDLKTNQVRRADANLNLDLDLSDGKDSFQANGTRRIVLVRTPLEGKERDLIVKGGPGLPPMPQQGGPQPGGPVVGGKTRIQGGGRDPEFSESAPAGGLLAGFEIGLQKFGNNDVVRAMRPIFRAGDMETFGTQRGNDLSRVVKVVAKPGYAVGAITAKAGLTVDGMSVTFMKITPNGRLDPNDAYESAWIGGRGGGAPMRLGGDGTPVIGVIGRTNMRDMTGLGLLLRQ